MGKWATYRKRGSNSEPTSFSLAPPGIDTFTLSDDSGGVWLLEFGVLAPGASFWGFEVYADGVLRASGSADAGSPQTDTEAPGVVMTARTRWLNGTGGVLSGWSVFEEVTLA